MTPEGRAYVQYTHDGHGMGQLVGVLPGLYDARPQDLAKLANQKELYFIFYTLNYALRDHQAEIVSHQPVPDWARPYPLMRWGLGDISGAMRGWKIFRASDPLTIENHRRTPVLRELNDEQRKLCIHELWPHQIMVKELARGWTPERDEELRLLDMAQADAREKEYRLSGQRREQLIWHFLYFPKKQSAEKAARRLRAGGFSVIVRKGADGKNWLTLASSTPPGTGEQMSELRRKMEALAAESHGEYDGWQLSAGSHGPAGDELSQTVN